MASVPQTRALVSLPGKSGSAPLLEILSPNTSCRLACSSIIVVKLHYTLLITADNEDKSMTKHSWFLKRANCVIGLCYTAGNIVEQKRRSVVALDDKSLGHVM